MSKPQNITMKLGAVGPAQLNLSVDKEASPISIASNSLMELRYAVSRLGLDDVHDLLDELENLILKGARKPA